MFVPNGRSLMWLLIRVQNLFLSHHNPLVFITVMRSNFICRQNHYSFLFRVKYIPLIKCLI